ncbi:MAG: MTH938/NDUFAF3 family protein [Woeseiaceae bacterium]|nr:MTH938/NDUFAF3 family protein [Woeseiaceae bacterium]
MNFSRENMTSLSVRRVEPGAIGIGERTITENVIIFRDQLRQGPAIDTVSAIGVSDIQEILDESPDIVILGTGWQTQRPPRELVFALARRGIGFESMDTPAACRTFNILLSEGRDVAAVLLIKE